jgi:hypothetical protein
VYLGGGIGLQKAGTSVSSFAATPTVCTPIPCKLDVAEHSSAPTIFGGVQFNEYAALEVGYVDLKDTYNVTLIDPNFPPPSLVGVDQDAEQVFLRGVLTLPLRHFELHPWLEPVSLSALIGIARWRSKMSFRADLRGAGLARITRIQQKDRGENLTIGARINYDATQQWRLSLSWDRYSARDQSPVAVLQNFPARVSTVKTRVNAHGVNVSYHFR